MKYEGIYFKYVRHITLEGETGNEYDVPPGRVDDDVLRLLGGLSSV